MNTGSLETMHRIISTFIPVEVKYDARTGDFTVELSAAGAPFKLKNEVFYFISFTGTMKQGTISTRLIQKEDTVCPEIAIAMIEKTDRTPIYEILRDSIQNAYNNKL